MTIRNLQSTDLPACADLFSSVFSNPPWNENWTVESAHHRLADCFATPNFLGVLAADEQRLAGFAVGYLQRYMEERHYFLLELCVDTHRQRQGIGRALLDQLTTQLKKAGANRAYTLTARDSAAQEFYAKAGFYMSPKMILMAHRFRS